MLSKAKQLLHEAMTAFARILFIFMVLSVVFDSATRIYYSYVPVNRWMDFQSVTVEMHGKEAVAVIQRRAISRVVSVFHRTLLIRYPEERRGCTASTVAILDDPGVDRIVVPLKQMLSDGCPSVLGTEATNAVLQVSYIFDFPYGVKRVAIRYSNKFSIVYRDQHYEVGNPVDFSLVR